MPFRRVSPEEALELMRNEGYSYVDVRSTQEFDAGHPQDAYNVPLVELGPFGMAENPDFLAVMQAAFAKDARLVVGCKSGGRSLRAASMLSAAGYTNVIDNSAGFDGGPGPRGFEAGWRPKGLPVSREAAEGRSYEALHKKLE